MLLPVNNKHGKISQSVDCQNFESVHALFGISTCVTTLHSCYIRTHLFSASQRHVISSCTLLSENFNVFSQSYTHNFFVYIIYKGIAQLVCVWRGSKVSPPPLHKWKIPKLAYNGKNGNDNKQVMIHCQEVNNKQ